MLSSTTLLFGITKPDTPAWSWFSKCKTILRRRQWPWPAGRSSRDTFCRASSFQEAVEIYLQLIKENPRALRNSTHRPRYRTARGVEKELTMIAELMHSELNFGMGVPNYGSDVMKMIGSRKLTVF